MELIMIIRIAGGLLWRYNPEGGRAALQGAVLRLALSLPSAKPWVFLLANVLGNRRLSRSDSRCAAAVGPELAVAVLLEHYEGALPF